MAGLLDFFAPPGLLDFLAPRGLLDFDPSPALPSYRRGRYRPADLLTGNQGPDSSGTGSLFDYRRVGLPSPDARGSAWPDRLNSSPPDALRRWAEPDIARRVRGDTDSPPRGERPNAFDNAGVISSPVYSDPFEAAAARVRNAARPVGGREEGVLSNLPAHLYAAADAAAHEIFEADNRMRLTGEYDPAILHGALLGVTGPAAVGRRAVATARPASKPLESKSAGLYDPPAKPARPFEADYPPEKWPNGPPTDAAGRLTQDIEGRRLTAKYVVGRGMAGAPDEAFPPEQLDALTKALTGRRAKRVPAEDMPVGAFGYTVMNRRGGRVALRDGLTPADTLKVHAHENGHAILSAEEISTKGIGDELTRVYNTLNNPYRTRDGLDAAPWAGLYGPSSRGYAFTALPNEYIAEALRAYMADPNYFKTVAPNTAARIRAVVNPLRRSKDTIQFNSVGGGMLGAGGLLPRADEKE